MLVQTMSRHTRRAWMMVVAGSALAGALLPIYPLYAYATAMVATSILMLSLGKRATKVFLVTQFSLVIGYVFLGRGFAYVYIPPVYVGEAVLALGCVAFVIALPARRPGLLQLLIAVFIVWGAARTLPYLGTFGLDALRDAAPWAYAVFALLISLMVQPTHIHNFVRLYGRIVPLFILWVPLFAFVWYATPDLVPTHPGSGVPIAFFKAGDLGVHLAGAAAFMLAGLYVSGSWRTAMQPVMWVVWVVGVGVVSALSRGGMLAIAAVAALPLFIRSAGRWATAILAGLLLLGIVGIVNPEVDLGGPRAVSVDQLVENVQSVFTTSTDPALAATRQWREEWWDLIIEYTVNGPYLWDGKGFGINLAEVDGFGTFDQSLRAPHSAHLNLLARGGVPLLVLWLAVQGAFAITMLRAAYSAARSRRPFWLGLVAWIFVYWLAALINMSFDVYLEGPQGGIPFWSLIGLGLAAASCLREQAEPESVREGLSVWRHRSMALPAAQEPFQTHGIGERRSSS